jgi:hypothetical protein
MSIYSYGNDASLLSCAASPRSKALWAPAPARHGIREKLLSNDWLHHYNKLKEAQLEQRQREEAQRLMVKDKYDTQLSQYKRRKQCFSLNGVSYSSTLSGLDYTTSGDVVVAMDCPKLASGCLKFAKSFHTGGLKQIYHALLQQSLSCRGGACLR